MRKISKLVESEMKVENERIFFSRLQQSSRVLLKTNMTRASKYWNLSMWIGVAILRYF